MGFDEQLPPRSKEEEEALKRGRVLGMVDYFLAQLRYAEMRKIPEEESGKMMAEDLNEVMTRFNFWTNANPEHLLTEFRIPQLGGAFIEGDQPKIIRGGPFELDITNSTVATPYLEPENIVTVKLFPIGRELAKAFFLNPNKVLPYRELNDRIWRGTAEKSTIATHVSYLRTTLGDYEEDHRHRRYRHFENIIKVGYRFRT